MVYSIQAKNIIKLLLLANLTWSHDVHAANVVAEKEMGHKEEQMIEP